MADYKRITNVIDNLTSTTTDQPLSANQGKLLNDSKLNLSGGTMTGELIVPATTGTTTANAVPTKSYVDTALNKKFDNIGTAITATTDVNTLKTAGHYRCETDNIAQSLANSPFTKSFTLTVDSSSGNTSFVTQIAQIYDTGEIKYRTCMVSSWSAWKSLFEKGAYTGTAQDLKDEIDLKLYSKAQPLASADWNTYTTHGHYVVKGGANGPSTDPTSYWDLTVKGDHNFIQEATQSTGTAKYVRAYRSHLGTWGNWNREAVGFQDTVVTFGNCNFIFRKLGPLVVLEVMGLGTAAISPTTFTIPSGFEANFNTSFITSVGNASYGAEVLVDATSNVIRFTPASQSGSIGNFTYGSGVYFSFR